MMAKAPVIMPRALASDLGLGSREDFDPLTAERALAWEGPRPDVLARISDAPWRSQGDTVERLDLLSLALVSGPKHHLEQDRLRFWRRHVIPSASVWMPAARAKARRCCARCPTVRAVSASGAPTAAGLRCSRRGAISFPSTAVPADPGGMAARLGVGRGASRPPSHGSRELATCRGSVGLGNLEHAHWRR